MSFQRFLRLSAFGAIFCGLVGTTAKAALINWTIDSARSAITVTAQVTDGTNVLAELQEQSPGSTIGAAEGTILSNVNFVAGRPVGIDLLLNTTPRIHGVEFHQGSPQVGGAPGSAPAAVAGRFELAPLGAADISLREVNGRVRTLSTIPLLDLGGEVYSFGGDFEFTANAQADILGSGALATLVGQTRILVPDLFQTSNAGPGSITIDGSLATLTLPIEIYPFLPLISGTYAELTLSGTITATAIVPEVGSVTMCAVFMLGVFAFKRKRRVATKHGP